MSDTIQTEDFKCKKCKRLLISYNLDIKFIGNIEGENIKAIEIECPKCKTKNYLLRYISKPLEFKYSENKRYTTGYISIVKG